MELEHKRIITRHDAGEKCGEGEAEALFDSAGFRAGGLCR
jgi:hypothetical protein